MSKMLDLGCGNKKRIGAIGIDNNNRTDADIIHDLNVFPYPLDDSAFNDIYLDNVLEHLDDVVCVVEEVYRISCNNGSVKVDVPYFRSLWAFMDPTHKHYFTVDAFSYFDPSSDVYKQYDYTLSKFKVENIVFNEGLPGRPFKKIMAKIANKWPRQYEVYLSHLFPLDSISYYLKTIK